jgi:serine/threonine-protein kinase
MVNVVQLGEIWSRYSLLIAISAAMFIIVLIAGELMLRAGSKQHRTVATQPQVQPLSQVLRADLRESKSDVRRPEFQPITRSLRGGTKPTQRAVTQHEPQKPIQAISEIRKGKAVDLSKAELDGLRIGSKVSVGGFGREMRILEIREGWQGRVYICTDQRGPKLALKTFKHFVGDSETSKRIERRFYNEAALWIGLGTHVNIVRAISFSRMSDRPYLVLEFVERNLRDWIPGVKSTHQALRLAKDVCSGLAYAHSKGILHRDIKPENVLVDSNGTAKVTDFGVARVFDEETGTISQDLTGTLPYMSPEEFGAASEGQMHVDTRSDVYSFGVLLYEVLTRNKPFTAQTIGELIFAHCHQRPSPPSSRSVFSLPRRVDELVLKCLEKDPSKRYQSFDLVLDGISRILMS